MGLFFVLISLPMAVNRPSTFQTVSGLVHDAPLLFVVGVILTTIGLAMVLSHNVWSGGPLPVVVTLVGWLTLAKGLLFLWLPPPEAVGIILWGPIWVQYFYVDLAIVFVLGAYLTYAGFKSGPARETSTSTNGPGAP
jgi:hypothetical protein